jgi:uncharacterized protein (TIGR03083 family)
VPAQLNLDEYLDAIEAAGDRLADIAAAAGLDTPVPTCPAWDVRALVAHQAMVHRWATAHVSGGDPGEVPTQTSIRGYDDLIGYYRDGVRGLVTSLRAAPPDLRAMTFLNDAPPPRMFWARRQAHETTVHGVDALAASVGRQPTADEAAVAPRLAVDGLDELLRGFYTRGASKLYDGTEETVVVSASDARRTWVLHVGPKLRVDDADGDDATTAAATATATLSATASKLYLGLWNRGDEITVTGDAGLLARWRRQQRVRWS